VRITLDLDEEFVRSARDEASRRGCSLDHLLGDALRFLIAASSPPATALPVSTRQGWVRPGIQIDDSRDLRARLDRERDIRQLT